MTSWFDKIFKIAAEHSGVIIEEEEGEEEGEEEVIIDTFSETLPPNNAELNSENQTVNNECQLNSQNNINDFPSVNIIE